MGVGIVFSLMPSALPCVLCRPPAKQDNEECSLVKMVLSTVDVPAKFTLYNVKTRALRGAWVACGVWRVVCGVWCVAAVAPSVCKCVRDQPVVPLAPLPHVSSCHR